MKLLNCFFIIVILAGSVPLLAQDSTGTEQTEPDSKTQAKGPADCTECDRKNMSNNDNIAQKAPIVAKEEVDRVLGLNGKSPEAPTGEGAEAHK